MKIIITVNFANDKFNRDFEISNALLSKHTVLMVTSSIQLINAINDYDIIIIGQSSFSFDNKIVGNKRVIQAENSDIINLLND